MFKNSNCIDDFKNLVLYPFNKYSYILVEFINYKRFNIIGIIDFDLKDDFIEISQKKIPIINNRLKIIEQTNEFDSVLFLDVSSSVQKSFLFDYFSDKKKNLYFMNYELDAKSINILLKNNVNFVTPYLEKDFYEYYIPYYETYNKNGCNKKIIGIFGTSENQNKSFLMHRLINIFSNKNIKSTMISDQSIGCFLGFNQIESKKYSFDKWQFYIKGYLKELEEQYDFIFIGDHGEFSTSIFNISLMSSFTLNISILCINFDDSLEVIEKNINKMRLLNRDNKLPNAIFINNFYIKNKEVIVYQQKELEQRIEFYYGKIKIPFYSFYHIEELVNKIITEAQ